MKKTRKILSLLLALAMMVSMLSVTAFADTMDNDHDRISVASGEYTTLVWDATDYHKGTITAVSDTYYPNTMVFYVDNGTISGVTATALAGVEGAYQLTLPATAGSFTVTLADYNHGNGVYTIYYSAPSGTKPTPGATAYAYLPAPGQFTNEGVTNGGWGDIYDASGAKKSNSTTGVSLGYFGGYVVYQFNTPVYNTSTNPYGADFIVYGNAFWNNSEPGCIQVSQDGATWYDIAGSRYYNSTTTKNASITYTNPNVSQDAGFTAAASNLGTPANVSYSGTASGTISTNTFHNHNWFPLKVNYFTGRYGNAEMSKIDSLPFASRTLSSGVAGTLTLSGVLLSGVTTNNTAGYGFGYCDVHPNKTLGGTVAYNPYQTFTSSSDYNTKTAGTSGGDPIDIAWAVDGDGKPVDLGSIQYVRIYTGAAMMNGIFGEVSTEVCGVAACSGSTTETTATPTITVAGTVQTTKNGKMTTLSKMGGNSVTVNVSGSGYIYINGTAQTSASFTPTNAGTIVQVIIQNGEAAPYITWLCLKK